MSFLFRMEIAVVVIILVLGLNVCDIVFKGKIRNFFTAPVLLIIYLICGVYLVLYLIKLKQG
jgi:hypothetical protein